MQRVFGPSLSRSVVVVEAKLEYTWKAVRGNPYRIDLKGKHNRMLAEVSMNHQTNKWSAVIKYKGPHGMTFVKSTYTQLMNGGNLTFDTEFEAQQWVEDNINDMFAAHCVNFKATVIPH